MAGCDKSCWEITRCGCEAKCLAKQREEEAKPCWDLAMELNDYRSAMNVCKDCIVYVTKSRRGSLSDAEVEEILRRKVECVLVDCGCHKR